MHMYIEQIHVKLRRINAYIKCNKHIYRDSFIQIHVKLRGMNAYIIAGAFKNARAKATRCFSPPLNWTEKSTNHKKIHI